MEARSKKHSWQKGMGFYVFQPASQPRLLFFFSFWLKILFPLVLLCPRSGWKTEDGRP